MCWAKQHLAVLAEYGGWRLLPKVVAPLAPVRGQWANSQVRVLPSTSSGMIGSPFDREHCNHLQDRNEPTWHCYANTCTQLATDCRDAIATIETLREIWRLPPQSIRVLHNFSYLQSGHLNTASIWRHCLTQLLQAGCLHSRITWSASSSVWHIAHCS